jgi:hypothetical protein
MTILAKQFPLVALIHICQSRFSRPKLAPISGTMFAKTYNAKILFKKTQTIPVMNMMQAKVFRHAYHIATGFCLSLQAIIQGKLTIRTKTIMCAQPVYPKAPSANFPITRLSFFSQQDI